MKVFQQKKILKSIVMHITYEVSLSVVFSRFEIMFKSPISFLIFEGSVRKKGKSLEGFSLYKSVCQP